MSRRKASKTVRPEARQESEAAGKPGRSLALPDRDELGIPELVPLLPLRSDVVFPQTVVPLVVNRTA
jgi:ATP-dependent Lon protease